jgi:hypothetical protein
LDKVIEQVLVNGVLNIALINTHNFSYMIITPMMAGLQPVKPITACKTKLIVSLILNFFLKKKNSESKVNLKYFVIRIHLFDIWNTIIKYMHAPLIFLQNDTSNAMIKKLMIYNEVLLWPFYIRR